MAIYSSFLVYLRNHILKCRFICSFAQKAYLTKLYIDIGGVFLTIVIQAESLKHNCAKTSEIPCELNFQNLCRILLSTLTNNCVYMLNECFIEFGRMFKLIKLRDELV